MSTAALAIVEFAPDIIEPVPDSRPPALVLEGWLGAMSPHTKRAYEPDMKQFDRWLAGRGLTISQVTPGLVTSWLADLASGAATGTPLSKATQARKLSAVTSFFRYARAEGKTLIDPAPFHRPTVKRDDARGSITAAQAQDVWAATEGNPRLRALVAVMLGSGLRVAEAVGLQVSDIQEQSGAKVLRVMGKGAQEDTVVLGADAAQAINDWLAVRVYAGPGDPLFSTKPLDGPDRKTAGGSMDTRAVHREIAALGRRVGITGLHPHTLRHTFATIAADKNATLLQIQTALRHKSPVTSMRYIAGRDKIRNSPVHMVGAAIFGNGPTG